MTKRQAFRALVFFLVVVLLVVLMCDLFEFANTDLNDRNLYTYRQYTENTIDTVFLGTSGVHSYWLSAKAYQDHGITSYPLAVDAMPPWLYTCLIEEAMTYQDPELFVLDIRPFGQNVTVDNVDSRGHRVLSGMDFFSLNRWKTAFKLMETSYKAGSGKRFDMSIPFSVIRFHSKWSDEDYSIENNLGSKTQKYGGYYMFKRVVNRKPQKMKTGLDDYFVPLDPLAEEALYETVEYIKEHDLNVLFIDTTATGDKGEIGRNNTSIKLLREAGMTVLDLNDPEELASIGLELDASQDFMDSGHVNFYGAQKFTDALAPYLVETYSLKDRRNEEAVKAEWDSTYENVLNRVAVYEAEKAAAESQ